MQPADAIIVDVYKFDAYNMPTKKTPREQFNPNSPGYQLVLEASKGNLQALDEALTHRFTVVDSLHRVTEKTESYYTALYYAAVKAQWAACALMWNRGINWATARVEPNKPPTTAINLLNSKENSLVYMLEALAASQEPLNVDSLAFLLSHPTLDPKRRQEVINNQELRQKLCGRLKKDEALFLMACLMIGSYHWAGSKTTFNDILTQSLRSGKEVLLPVDGTISCNHILFYASMLAGQKTLFEIAFAVMTNGPGTSEEKMQKFYSDNHATDKDYAEVTREVNTHFATILGLSKRSNQTRLKLADTSKKVQVVYFENEHGIIEHYGLLYHSKRGPMFIHITQELGTVTCEHAKQAITRKSPFSQAAKITAIYAGTLPWHLNTP